MTVHLQGNSTLEGWQNGGSDRSSWDILWSSLTTIFACTWTVLHLNIPSPGLSETRRLLQKFRWLLITVLAPEVITAYSFGEFLQARQLLQQLKDHGIAQSTWGMSHSFFISMGSVCFVTRDQFEIPFCVQDNSDDGWQQPTINRAVLILYNKEKTAFQQISLGDIRDRSKADAFVKGFTILQASWFILNAVLRAADGLPISPLEISCMAYVFCTCITYSFWWSKPKDVLHRTDIPCNFSMSDLPSPIKAVVQESCSRGSVECHYRWRSLRLRETEAQILSVIRSRMPALMGLVIGVIFCSIHLAAWEFLFPTKIEAMIWRISSVTSAAVPILSVAIVYVRSLSPRKFDKLWSAILAIYILLIISYVITRLIIITMLFTTLRALPSGSYLTASSIKAIPHI
jgi:hypothetical protein